MKKPVLAMDVDDVLVSTAAYVLQCLNERFAVEVDLATMGEDGVVVEYMRKSGRPEGEVVQEVGKVFHEEGFWGLKPADGAVTVMERLSERFEIVTTTARSKEYHERTRTWLGEHFPGLIREMYFPNGCLMEGLTSFAPVDKLAQLGEVGAVWLVGDAPGHFEGAHRYGIRGALFGDYPWNRAHTAVEEGVVRVRDWVEVERLLVF